MIENIFGIWWKARKIMKRPKIRWRFRSSSNPYGILRPTNNILSLESRDLGWKDKYDTPRFEYSPQVSLWILGKWQVSIEFDISEDFEEDQYWEQLLWIRFYQDGKDHKRVLTEEDWILAKNNWPWISEKNGKKCSTWIDKFHL